MGSNCRLIILFISITLLSILTSSIVIASENKFISVDYPSIVGPGEFFDIVIHIDPSVAKYVNYIVFDDVISDLKLSPNYDLSPEVISSCRDIIIPYDGSPSITIPVYYDFYWSDAIKSHSEQPLISLEYVDSAEKINSLLNNEHYNIYTPSEENSLNHTFIYPFECTSNGDFEWSGIPVLSFKLNQEVVPREVNLDLPKGAVIKDGLYQKGISHFKVGLPFYYSNPGGLESGSPPYSDFQFSSHTFKFDYDLSSYIFPDSYDSFKSFFDDETSGLGSRGESTFDMPRNILNSFNADFGFYTYDITNYHDSLSENPDEMYYYLDLIFHVYPKNYFGYYSIWYIHSDITDSFSESDIVDEALDLVSTIHLDFESTDFLKKDLLYAVNDEALNLLSGNEFEAPPEEDEEEQKNISSKEFTIDFSGSDSETIWNRGRFNVEDDDSFTVLIKIAGEAKDSEGKRIKKVSESDLFSGVELISEIQGKNESQIGLFSSLSKNNSRHIYSDLETVEVRGKGPRLYKSFYHPKEAIKFHLEWKGTVVSNSLTFDVDVKDASPSIELKKSTIKVQDGDKRGVFFTVKDADKSKLSCSIMVPTDYAMKNKLPFPVLGYDGQKSSFIKFDCADADKISFMFNAPSFGNFDLNSELTALSMWKMQENTMVTLASDLVAFGVGKRLDSLKQSESLQRVMGKFTNNKDMLANAKQMKSAIDTLDKANTIATQSQNAIKIGQVVQNKNALSNDLKEASKSNKKGWLEWGSDWGIYGINVAQSTVGAIAMLPGKIPVVGPLGKKLGGTFSMVFNLMTNVWKGNFQYLSKVEKINRAQEMLFPYPVIITVQDVDGFETKSIQNMMVVYNWLE